MKRLTCFLFSFWLIGEVCGQTDTSTTFAMYTNEEILVDGFLNEEIWKSAQKIDRFTQRELHLGQSATERTEVAIVYNETYMYVGVWCYDSEPNKIIAKELKRDFDTELDDNFVFILDTYHDKRNAFYFATNPNGARLDAQIFNNGSTFNEYWNGVWDVKTKRTSEGWFAEFVIPFTTLKFRNKHGEMLWGVNFERSIRRKREQVRWCGWSRDFGIEHVIRAGELKGIKNIGNKQFVEFKPYALAGGESSPDGEKGVINAGADINYLLSPTYRLNLTVNTDFAQVESDQQQINITRFPLYFPELREFFLEGEDYFDMGYGGDRIQPFYTRRIGLNDNREPVPILAGARLLGKEKNSTIGLMSIQTAEKGATPSTNYSAASWRQDIGNQSVVGAMTTTKITQYNFHNTTALNGRYSTANFLKDKNLNIGATYVHTYQSDSGFSGNSYAYRVYATYINDLFDVVLTSQRSPQEFKPEVGLQRRENFIEHFALIAFKPRPKNKLKFIRQFYLRPAMLTLNLYEDDQTLQSFNYNFGFMGFETRKGESVNFNFSRQAEGLRESFALTDDIEIDSGVYWWNSWNGSFSTFQGRPFSMEGELSYGGFFEGNAFQAELGMLWRANKSMNLELSYGQNRINYNGASLNSDQLVSRLEYAFSPNAFGSVVAQWNNFEQEMILNMRLRWIPKIGTDVFLIVNDLLNQETGTWETERATVLGKVIWRFVL
jgi:hypothetical protein